MAVEWVSAAALIGTPTWEPPDDAGVLFKFCAFHLKLWEYKSEDVNYIFELSLNYILVKTAILTLFHSHVYSSMLKI